MKLSRRQLRRIILQEVRLLVEGAQEEAKKKFGEDGKKAVGIDELGSSINMDKRKAKKKAIKDGGKSNEVYKQLKYDEKTYVVCVMDK
jgi:hypothetical protein